LIDLVRRHPPGRTALVEPTASARLGYGELADRVDHAAEWLRATLGGRGLAFLAMGPDIDSVVIYLGCLSARVPLCLVETESLSLARLVGAYQPELLLLPETLPAPEGYRERGTRGRYHGWSRHSRSAREPGGERTALHPDLALLLTTSGSTGNPKLVRLTLRNLESNARSIARYLELGPDERPIQSLAMHYSYGLSVLNSHLLAGGTVVLTPHSFLRPEFWKVFDEERCTSFAGVPYVYETLHRLRFDPARHPSLRTMTQAGGGLRPDLIAHFQQLFARAGRRFFVMYGQTEATARISYVPWEALARKIGSIGIAIPDGRLSLAPVEGAEDLRELVYEGPNVMMGYAEGPEDLAQGDLLGGVLRTGDLGAVDEDGYFRVVGRLKRFAKLFGRRISLEDVERDLEAAFPVHVAVLDGADHLVVHVEQDGSVPADALALHVAHRLSVPPGAIVVRPMRALPRTSSGKKDYRALERVAP